MNGMFPGNHSLKWRWAMQLFLFFILFCFFLFFFVSEGWRAVLAYLLIMCEYFYFESEINKISPFSNVTRCWMFFFFMYPKISQNGMFFAFAFELIRLTKS